MDETYLITGGAGNLASRVSLALAALGKHVVLVDVAERCAAPLAEDIEYIRCDLTDSIRAREVLKECRPAAVLHFAALLSGQSEIDRRAAWSLNMTTTFELFETLLELGIPRVLFTSSIATYGDVSEDPLPEDYVQTPKGFYGVTKLAMERLGEYYHARHGLDFRALRVPIVLSPRHATSGAASAYIAKAFVDAFSTGRFTFNVRPETSPALVYIDDVVQGLINLLEAPEASLSRRTYNIYSLSPSAAEIADAIRRLWPDAELTFQPDPVVVRLMDGWPRRIVDDSARQDWKWRPEYDLSAAANDLFKTAQGMMAAEPQTKRALA